MIPKQTIDSFGMSQEEVVKELEELGIRIIYKPIALTPVYLVNDEKYMEYEQTDIYEALNKIIRRRAMTKNFDPFS
jgi:uncharacterized protein (UPF0210 family)